MSTSGSDSPEDEQVRRLLRSVGESAEPLPPDVAERLDTRLARLLEERAHEGLTTTSQPDQLAARRRRRAWSRGLVAAAAVVVGGYGISAIVSETGLSGSEELTAGEGPGDSADGGGPTADGGDGGIEEALPEVAEPSAAQGQRDEAPEAVGTQRLSAALPRLRSERLAADVSRLLAERANEDQRTGRAPADPDAWDPTCAPPGRPGPADWFAVTYDGRRGLLLVDDPRGEQRRARVYSCAGAQLDQTSVPAP